MEQEELIRKIEERKGDRTYSNIITALWAYGFENGDDEAVAVDDLQGVVNYVGKRFRDDAVGEPNVSIRVQGKAEDLSDKYVFAKSEVYHTDDSNGVCVDGDPLSIRYVKNDANRIFKMKCGKFFRRLIDEVHPEFPEPVRVYFAEQLSAMYRAGHASDGRYRLTLDDDFETIYSVDGFGSCMTHKGQWDYYADSTPDALAAGLWDGDKLIARCIVWNKVYDDDDESKVYRLAERQYGINSEARRQLVYLLAEQGKIDGHKQFEAGCYDSRSYVLLDGTRLNDRHLYVRCTAEPGDTLSFQDGFRFLNFSEERAMNWEGDYDCDLATTNSRVPGNSNDVEDGDTDGDMRYVARDGEWFHDDHTRYLDYRQEWCHEDDCVYSEWTDQYYLNDDATCLYNDEYCHDDSARRIEAGEHEGDYAYYEDDDLVRDYDDRYVLIQDCYELTHGVHEGAYAPCDECEELDERFYGMCAYALRDETLETFNCETILENDAVEIDGCYYHKDDCVRAFDRRARKFVDAIPDDCVEIRGTYYLMCVA